MKEILPDCLYEPGAKITVTKKTRHRMIPPASTCFMSRFFAAHPHAPNIVTLELIITKNGKKGKDRVNRIEVATAIFPIEFEKRSLKSGKYQNNPVIEIERSPFDISDVLKISPMDFIGWAYAYKIYLRGVFACASIQNKWPPGKGQYVNSFAGISARIAKTPDETIDQLACAMFRENFTKQLRGMEAGISQCVLRERIKCAKMRVKAIAYLLWSEKTQKKNLYGIDMLTKNYIYYRSLLDMEQDQYYQTRFNRWSSLSAKKRKLTSVPKKAPRASSLKSMLYTIEAYIKAEGRPDFDKVVLPDHVEQPKIWYNPQDDIFSVGVA